MKSSKKWVIKAKGSPSQGFETLAAMTAPVKRWAVVVIVVRVSIAKDVKKRQEFFMLE